VRVLGLDEWAKRKGHTYAPVLVDQERHRIVDVLPDDQPETVAAWLHAHPTIELVTRDRDEVFAKAIAMGAPDATQVADRFHLLQNLRDVLERVFHRHRPGPGDTTSPHPPGVTDGPAAPTPPLPRAERRAQVQTLTALGYSQTAIAERLGIDRRTVRQDAAAAPVGPPTQPLLVAPDPPDASVSPAQQRRQAQWQAIRDRVAAGQSVSTIARALRLDRGTVSKYAQAQTPPPPPRSRPQPGVLHGWTAALDQRWSAGEHQAQSLFRALQEAGYPGGVGPVRRWVRRRRQQLQGTELARVPRARIPPRTLAWHCLQRIPDWSPRTARELLTATADPTVREAYTLAHLFRTLVKYRRPQALEPWLRRAAASPLPEFQRFAQGLRHDLAAVTAAVQGPWSQGPVEGFNHKIKRLKRVMYGRAKFDLLRARILHTSS
jgi:transposase/DNA-binding transcriptional regulator YdaS (Cro superfamily)